MAKKLILVGLIQPKDKADDTAFKEWYLGNHIEDTFHCPNMKAVQCFKATKGFLGDSPSGYITIYEAEGEDAEAAEKILNAYQADPESYADRMENNDSMEIVGAGWYLEEVSFGD